MCGLACCYLHEPSVDPRHSLYRDPLIIILFAPKDFAVITLTNKICRRIYGFVAGLCIALLDFPEGCLFVALFLFTLSHLVDSSTSQFWTPPFQAKGTTI